jgi:aminodeoxyfutalosine synthase
MTGQMKSLKDLPGLDPEIKSIAEKIENQVRISPEEGLMLFEKGSLATLGAMANYIR